jgi:hypothetical protein
MISVIKSKRISLAGHVASMGDIINTHIFVGIYERERPFGRPMHKSEDN